MTFKEYCEKEGVRLTKLQQNAATDILESPNCMNLLWGIGCGATFLFQLLEQYAREDH